MALVAPAPRTDAARRIAEEHRLGRIPRHVAIIMDGNGRWARGRGLPRLAGHRAGTENVRLITTACADVGVEVLTIYAFSTENWSRPLDEVRGLMTILAQSIDREAAELHRHDVQIRHVGSLEGINPGLAARVRRAVQLTRNNSRMVLNVAFNYGGRAEIARAVRRMVEAGIDPSEIDEKQIGQYLDTAGLPDPDLVIRTAGEMRLSNFLLWQAAYAEYYATSACWPEFGRDELFKALAEYGHRVRRFGGVV